MIWQALLVDGSVVLPPLQTNIGYRGPYRATNPKLYARELFGRRPAQKKMLPYVGYADFVIYMV
jgi:hypothetical protein